MTEDNKKKLKIKNIDSRFECDLMYLGSRFAFIIFISGIFILFCFTLFDWSDFFLVLLFCLEEK